MENWGLITYRETALLYDPKMSSNGNKERIATIIAHELAHMVRLRPQTSPPLLLPSPPLLSHCSSLFTEPHYFSSAVVWEPCDAEVVERFVAERGVRLLR